MPDPQKYLLGLDAGNTVIKAVLFDLSGNEIAKHALDGQSSTPQPGHVERDLGELWENAVEVIKTCIAKAGISPEMAIRLSIAFDTSAESWMNQQAQYDLWQAEQHRDELHVSKLSAA